MKISAEALSQPIAEDAPCGPDLEYDPVFQQVETLMQDHGEQVLDEGEEEGPDWKAMAEPLTDLLGRTRDLRVFVNAAVAGLNTDGIPVFHQALVALNNCMEQYWDDIHPKLDPDDNFDPMMRMNVLQNLADYENVRQGMKRCPLVELKGVGSFSLRDMEIAQGRETPAEGEEVIDSAIVEGAFRDSDPEELAALVGAITGSLDELDRLLAIWAEKTENSEAPGVDPTIQVLREVASAIASVAPSAGLDPQAAAPGEGGAAPVQAPPGTINSRADVQLALERICDYYKSNEPSSPIPYILERAKGLVAKDFMEILKDIAPDGMNNAKMVTGYKDD